MTLDEMIKHAEEVAEKNETQAKKWQKEGGEKWGKTTVCRERAEEYRQIAEWLKDYQGLFERIKQARAEIEDRIDNYPDRNISEYEDCLAIIDNIIKEHEGENNKFQDTDLDLDR